MEHKIISEVNNSLYLKVEVNAAVKLIASPDTRTAGSNQVVDLIVTGVYDLSLEFFCITCIL